MVFEKRGIYKICLIMSLFIILVFGPGLASASDVVSLSYVALGDSYASGFGVEPYAAGTYDPSVNDCQRSESAYPELLSKMIGSNLSFNACQGALTGDLLSKRTRAGEADWGESAQLDHLNQGGANLGFVTLSIGGNDVGFKSILSACYNGWQADNSFSCRAKYQGKVAEKLQALSGETVFSGITPYSMVFNEIAKRAPQAKVAIVGYPHLFDESGSCGIIPQADRVWLNGVVDELDRIMETRAREAGFLFVKPVFNGHEICSQDEWLFPMLQAGTLIPNPGAMHPNAAGQEAIAAAIADAFAKGQTSRIDVKAKPTEAVEAINQNNLTADAPQNLKQVKGVKRYADGTLLRSLKSKKIYLLKAGNKALIENLEQLGRFRGMPIYGETEESLAQYPEIKLAEMAGLKDGALCRASKDKKIYVIREGKKRHIINLAELRKYAGQPIINLSDAELDLY